MFDARPRISSILIHGSDGGSWLQRRISVSGNSVSRSPFRCFGHAGELFDQGDAFAVIAAGGVAGDGCDLFIVRRYPVATRLVSDGDAIGARDSICRLRVWGFWDWSGNIGVRCCLVGG